MSTYPASLDDLGASNPSSSTQMDDGAGHAAQHADANDAIDAIQTTLGVDPQGGSTDVATRLDDLAFADLADVDMSGISDGDVPVWSAGTSKFEPGAGGGGGLVLVDSGTFSAASSVSLPNGSFDSTYDDYELHVSYTGGSNHEFYVRLRASGSDDTASTYGYNTKLAPTDSGFGSLANAADSQWYVGWTLLASRRVRSRLMLYSPALAEETGGDNSTVGGWSTSTGHVHCFGGLQKHTTTAYDSLTFYPSTGTITGRWAVYGYAK